MGLKAIIHSLGRTPAPESRDGKTAAEEKDFDLLSAKYEDVIWTPPLAAEGRAQASPTRPHSMRQRQSMQVLDLEKKVEQLAAENRMLAEAKAQAERTLHSSPHRSLVDKDVEIDSLKRTLDRLQNEVTRLTQVNEGLDSAHIELGRQHNERHGTLESQHVQATHELEEVRNAYENLSAGMEGIVSNEVQTAVQAANEKIQQLEAANTELNSLLAESNKENPLLKREKGELLSERDATEKHLATKTALEKLQAELTRQKLESVSDYKDMHEAMTQLVEEATKKAFDVEARLKRSEANLRIKDAELAEALVGCFLE
jgi:chromosome segregation ATPase